MKMKLSFKFFIGIAGIAFLASGATGSYFYYQTKNAFYENIRQELQGIALSGAKIVNGDNFVQIQSEQDAKTEGYKRIQRLLNDLEQSNPDILFAYTMRFIKNKVYFVVDSSAADYNHDGKISDLEGSEDIGAEYKDPAQSLLHGFVEVSADLVPVLDNWGWTFSAYAPIFDSKGQSVGLLGVDMSVNKIEEKLEAIRRAGFISLCSALSIALVITLFFSRLMSRPILSLKNGFNEIVNGNYNIQLTPSSNDELGDLVLNFNSLVLQLKEKEFLKMNMGRILDPKILDTLLKNGFENRGDMVNATIIFCDLRGFTAFSEKTPPAVIVTLLNQYFSAMVNVIEKYGGMVDKFVGDSVMAVFGHPIPLDNEQQSAVEAGIEMLKMCDYLNDELKLTGKYKLQNSIGIHSGYVIAGTIGSSQRMEYTVIGDSVNIASRLEHKTRQLSSRMAVSKQTVDGLENIPAGLTSIGSQKIRGRSQNLEVFILKS